MAFRRTTHTLHIAAVWCYANLTMYTCPVCGFDRLRRPPLNFLICQSCGTEFGYSDSTASYRQLQAEWIANGLRWHSNVIPPPSGWNAYKQLRNIGVIGASSFESSTNVGLVDLSSTHTLIESAGGSVRLQRNQYRAVGTIAIISGNTMSNPPMRVYA
jgi:hypothetical protein